MKETNSQKSRTLNQMIQMLNEKNPQIQIELVKTSNDTAFVKIEKSDFLTQQCGTAGADSYLASVVYNLTEFKNIECVNFDFELGDHAVPGKYSRNDFVKF
jgi:spore germination protein GerM